jgi:ubiquinone/menaquinone biosynthesis C-methylase UbiE
MIIGSVKKLLYSAGIVRRLSLRRFIALDRLLHGRLIQRGRERKAILDVGCSRGKDLVQFLEGRDELEITGLDVKDFGLRQDNFRMVAGDAEALPFRDGYFDITFSIGVLEHIRPIEKLAKVAREIDRVSKAYVVVVPSVGTTIEPHIARLLWQLRDRNRKPHYPGTLVYLSDEAWLAFDGFAQAKTRRYSHLPFLVSDLIIYKLTARQTVASDA